MSVPRRICACISNVPFTFFWEASPFAGMTRVLSRFSEFFFVGGYTGDLLSNQGISEIQG